MLIKSLQTFAGYIPLGLLQNFSRQRLLMPFYHTISDKKLPHIEHLYQVRNTKLFSKDLEYLLEHFSPIDLHQLIQFVEKGKALPKNAFFLSFDDGLSECYHIIAPILKKKGIPATFFLNSDFLDNKSLMFRYKASYLIEELQHRNNIDTIIKKHFSKYQLPYLNVKESLLQVRWHHEALLNDLAQEFGIDFNTFLETQQPYLNSQQVKEMQVDGFTFGSHSQNHPTYNKISLDDQIAQTTISQDFVSNQFNPRHKVFAFPFTDVGVSKAFFDRVLLKDNFQLTFGGAGLKHELIKGQLQRFGIETQQNQTVRQLIHSEYFYFMIKSLFRKNTIRRD
jgi:peptidoglycan/xylan/chitin deacetylase (PgdA/CDA1 family)